MNSETAIIIPVYNEATVLKSVINNVQKQFAYVVCVNDGSNDNSADIIAQEGAFLVNHPINLGQGAALQTGIEFARSLPVKYFCTFDADGQHSLKDVQVMLQEIKKGSHDIILGSRFLGKAYKIPLSKKVLLKLATRFTNSTTGLRLTDTHNGLRVFNKKVADGMKITLPDMAHASEILEIISEKGYRYKEIPVTIAYTEYSMSKGQSLINAINIGFDTVLRRVVK